MRLETEVRLTLLRLSERRSVVEAYQHAVFDRGDLHGQMDVAADLRELDAAIVALDWVLGAEEEPR